MSAECSIEMNRAGGMTASVFPRVEAMLELDSALQRALLEIASRDDHKFFFSEVDFLFCTLFPLYRGACERFYAGDEEAFRDRTTKEMRAKFEDLLVHALHVLARARERGTVKKSWLQSAVVDSIPRP